MEKMEAESDEVARPRFEILTPTGRSRNSRGYTGPGTATYLIDEEGTTERFAGEYVGGIRQGAGKPLHSASGAFGTIHSI